jgi:hypothetical protein
VAGDIATGGGADGESAGFNAGSNNELTFSISFTAPEGHQGGDISHLTLPQGASVAGDGADSASDTLAPGRGGSVFDLHVDLASSTSIIAGHGGSYTGVSTKLNAAAGGGIHDVHITFSGTNAPGVLLQACSGGSSDATRGANGGSIAFFTLTSTDPNHPLDSVDITAGTGDIGSLASGNGGSITQTKPTAFTQHEISFSAGNGAEINQQGATGPGAAAHHAGVGGSISDVSINASSAAGVFSIDAGDGGNGPTAGAGIAGRSFGTVKKVRALLAARGELA